MTNGEKYKTTNERTKLFTEWWSSKGIGYAIVHNYIEDAFAWLYLEAEDEKPLPCPFCGAGCYAIDHHSPVGFRYKIWCSQCSYSSMQYKSRDEAIAAHNRVAKKCREGKE